MNYYAFKVSHLKRSKSKEWWREVKVIWGMTSPPGSTNLLSQLQIETSDNLTPKELAILVNRSFLQPIMT